MSTWSHPWFDPWKGLTSNRPWQSTLEDWWEQFSKQPSSSLQAFENIVSQSRSFFKLAEELSGAGTRTETAADWQVGLAQIFDTLRQSFADPGAVPNLFWQMPLANWQRTASSLSSFPGDLFAGAGLSGGIDADARLDQFLTAQPLGYAREHQEQYQQLSRLLLDYQRAQQKYAAVLANINQRSLDRMQARLSDRMRNNQEPITSVRELFNLWIECSEETYGQYVLTDEYAELHGRLVNALMALKQQGAKMVDDTAGALNVPTRKEMDTVHHRLQSSRRNEKFMQRELEAAQAKLISVAGQVGALQAKLEQLQTQALSKAPRRTVKKRAVKKLPVKKASAGRVVTKKVNKKVNKKVVRKAPRRKVSAAR
jgi:class III poly(R)-hydroxyalkanoic acid synthase PhaE subunit